MKTFKEFLAELTTVKREQDVGVDVNSTGRGTNGDKAPKRQLRDISIHPRKLTTNEPLSKTAKATASPESENTIQSIMKAYRNGESPFESHPLLVKRNSDGTHTVLDGHHRAEAARRLGLKHLLAHILPNNQVIPHHFTDDEI